MFFFISGKIFRDILDMNRRRAFSHKSEFEMSNDPIDDLRLFDKKQSVPVLFFYPFDGIGQNIAGFIFIGELDLVGPSLQLKRSNEGPA